MIRLGLKSRIMGLAKKNSVFSNRLFASLGALSPKAEHLIRFFLYFPPEIIESNVTPDGNILETPLRMLTAGGRDQISRQIYFDGIQAFEPPVPALITAFMRSRDPGAFLDIGANTGLYSLLCKAIAPAREVYAFEPFPPILSLLNKNISLNPYADNIHVVNVAASDSEGTARLFIPTQEHGLVETSASLSATFKGAHSTVVDVRTARLDNFCKQENIGPISLIKIDVEGFEAKVISGLLGILVKDKPAVFCEVIDSSKSAEEISRFVIECDYKIASIGDHQVTRIDSFSSSFPEHNHIFYHRDDEEKTLKIIINAGLAVI